METSEGADEERMEEGGASGGVEEGGSRGVSASEGGQERGACTCKGATSAPTTPSSTTQRYFSFLIFCSVWL